MQVAAMKLIIQLHQQAAEKVYLPKWLVSVSHDQKSSDKKRVYTWLGA